MIRGTNEDYQFNTSRSISFGYIILPSNFESGINRDKYIENCYRRERVSILPERGGTPIHNCPILKSALKDIYFPENSRKLGSGICFLSSMINGHPIVLGVLSKMDESGLESEYSYKIFKSTDGGHVLAVFNAKTNQIIIESIGRDKPASLKINIADKNSSSTFDLNVSGDVNLDVSNIIDINSRKKINMESNGSSITLDGLFSIKNKEQDLKVILNDLISEIKKLTVTTGMGPSGTPINTLAFEEINSRIDKLLK